MNYYVPASTPPAFRPGRVLLHSMQFYFTKLHLILGMGLLLMLPEHLLELGLMGWSVERWEANNYFTSDDTIHLYFLLSWIWDVSLAFLQAVFVFAVFARLTGGTQSFAGLLYAVAARAPVLFVLALGWSVIQQAVIYLRYTHEAGLIFMFADWGMQLAGFFLVAVCVLDGRGILGSLSQSVRLFARLWWRIVVLWLVIQLIHTLLMWGIGHELGEYTSGFWPHMIEHVLYFGFAVLVPAMAYVHVVLSDQGLDAAKTADVFD